MALLWACFTLTFGNEAASQLQELDGMLYAHAVAPSGCSPEAWIDAVDKSSFGNTGSAISCLKLAAQLDTAFAILELMLQTYGMFGASGRECTLPESKGAVGSSLSAAEPRMWAFFFIAWDLRSMKGIEQEALASGLLAPYHQCATEHAPSRGFFNRALWAYEQRRKLESGAKPMGVGEKAKYIQKLLRKEHGKFFMAVSRASTNILAWIGQLCGDPAIAARTTGGGMSIGMINVFVESCLKEQGLNELLGQVAGHESTNLRTGAGGGRPSMQHRRDELAPPPPQPPSLRSMSSLAVDIDAGTGTATGADARDPPESIVHAVGLKGVTIESDFGRSEMQRYVDALKADAGLEGRTLKAGLEGRTTTRGAARDQVQGDTRSTPAKDASTLSTTDDADQHGESGARSIVGRADGRAGGASSAVPPCPAPLHKAVRMGWLDIARQLVDLGFSSIYGKDRSPRFIGDVDLDRYGHRAIDVACMHLWNAYAIATAFGKGVVKYCATNFPDLALSPRQPSRPYAFPPPDEDRGGWIGGDDDGNGDGAHPRDGHGGPLPSTCDFDVWEGPFTEARFLEQYVSISRPVLMRGLMIGPYWDSLRRNWTAHAISANYPAPWFKPAGLPFGQKLGQQHGGKVNIPVYMEWLAKHRKQNQHYQPSSTTKSSDHDPAKDAVAPISDAKGEHERFMAMVRGKEAEGWVYDKDGSVLTNEEGGRITLLPPPKPGARSTRAPSSSKGQGGTGGAAADFNAHDAKPLKDHDPKTQKTQKEALPFVFAALPSQAAQSKTPSLLELALIEQSLPEIGFGSHAQSQLQASSSRPSTPRSSKILVPSLYQFFLSANGTGAPLHFHTHAINALVYGRKRWFAVAPRFEVTARQDVAAWAGDGRTKMEADGVVVHECIQEQGDVLYIPEHWSHAVLNLAESVGIATEFTLNHPPPIAKQPVSVSLDHDRDDILEENSEARAVHATEEL